MIEYHNYSDKVLRASQKAARNFAHTRKKKKTYDLTHAFT